MRMHRQIARRRRARAPRGFTLIELMISMAILAIAILGVAQMQVVASAQNGLARRTTRASALLRDFQETASSFRWGDPRLVPVDGTCHQTDGLEQVTEDSFKFAEAPDLTMDFTALAAGDPAASSAGSTTSGLTAGGTTYRGIAASVPAEVWNKEGYQLSWRTRNVDTNGDGTCEARLVDVVVRFRIGNSDRWRSYVGHFMQYDPTSILPGPFFNFDRMENW